MPFEVTKEFEFSAAHHLPGHPKCGQVHRHNYRVRVTFKSTVLQDGMVIDFGQLKEKINPIIQDLDHRDLNEYFANSGFYWEDYPPTAEHIAKFIFEQIKRRAHWFPYNVAVFETPDSSAKYYEEDEIVQDERR